MLDQPVTLEELRVAADSFANNKTPSCDGIPAEFYSRFFNLVGTYLHQAILFAFDNGQLHISARRGILTLIPKKDQDLLLLKNWRPLTMLTLDYKILAKALDTRLKKVLPFVIDKTQTGFMEGRNIMTNIINLIHV